MLLPKMTSNAPLYFRQHGLERPRYRETSHRSGRTRHRSTQLQAGRRCAGRIGPASCCRWTPPRAQALRQHHSSKQRAGDGNHGLILGQFVDRRQGESEHSARCQITTKNNMKTAFLLCTAISAALILGGCANQDSAAQTNASSSSRAQYSSVPSAGRGVAVAVRREGPSPSVTNPRQPSFQAAVCYPRNRFLPRS